MNKRFLAVGRGHALRAFWAIQVSLFIMLTLGCGSSQGPSGGGNLKGPPDDLVERELRGALPSYLEVRNLRTEKLKSGETSFTVNCKLSVVPKEDLYLPKSRPGLGGESGRLMDLVPAGSLKTDASLRQEVPKEMLAYNSPYRPKVERLLAECAQTPEFTKLMLVKKAAQEVSVYAKATAEKLVDTWRVDNVVFETDVRQLGSPQSTFGPNHLIPDSAQAKEAVARFVDERKKSEAQIAALIDEYKRDHEAKQKMKEEEAQREQEALKAYFDRLVAATAPGSKYSGTFKSSDMQRSGPILLQFSKQNADATMLEAELSIPDDTEMKRLYLGNVSREAKTKFPIRLRPDPNSGVVLQGKQKKNRGIFGRADHTELGFALDEGGNLILIESAGVAYKIKMSPLKRMP